MTRPNGKSHDRRGRRWRMIAGALLPFALNACTLFKKKSESSKAPTPQTTSPASPIVPTPTPGPSTPNPPAPPKPPLLDENKLNTAFDIVDYARFCKQEIGIPAAVQAPFNCLDGVEIPITVEGQPLSDQSYQTLTTSHAGCDRPSWLGQEPCSNYAFVLKRELAKDVTALLLCRMRSFATPKDRATRQADYEKDGSVANFRALYDFDSLGLIWTNKATGKTCFFDYVGKTYGGYVPSPDDAQKPAYADLPDPKPPKVLPAGYEAEKVWQKDARGTWKVPSDVVSSDNCIRCHDTGAFKSSPWVDQVMKIPANDPAVPFQIVGKVFQDWHDRFPLAAISTTPVAKPDGTTEPQLCTSCHRIGNQASCESQISYSIGRTAPVSLSNLGKNFFVRTWMPPLSDEHRTLWNGKTEAEISQAWSALYDSHVSKLLCCCQDPTAKGCTSQDITQSPLAAPVAGTGPGECQ